MTQQPNTNNGCTKSMGRHSHLTHNNNKNKNANNNKSKVKTLINTTQTIFCTIQISEFQFKDINQVSNKSIRISDSLSLFYYMLSKKYNHKNYHTFLLSTLSLLVKPSFSKNYAPIIHICIYERIRGKALRVHRRIQSHQTAGFRLPSHVKPIR